MGSIKDLPVEILCDIFSHLKRKIVGVKSSDDIKIVKLAGQDVFECQLVCKKWMLPAQQIIYKEIYLKGLEQLHHFTHLMTNSKTPPPSLMTEAILIDPQNDIVFFASFFMALSLLCPGVKIIHSVQVPSNYFWSVLMRERYEGNLEKLEVVPPVNTTKLACILHYELAAWSLYETLTHLHVFDWLPIPGKNITRLGFFANLKTLKLNLEDFRYIYGLDKAIHDRLESIDIDLELKEGTTLPNPDRPVNLANVEAFPNVKKLTAKHMVTNDTVVSYLMRMLPGLKDLIIFFAAKDDLEQSEVGKPRLKPLSTKVGIQFLEYLNKISNALIDNVHVQDPLAILVGFYEKSLDSLEIEYDIEPQGGEIYGFNSYFRLIARDATSHVGRNDCEWAPIAPVNDKTRFKTIVAFEVKEETEIMPHMELVEYFGHDLKSLTLDFGENSVEDKRNLNEESASNGQYLNHIIQHCPQLKNLTLTNTNLENCNFDIQPETRFLDCGDWSLKVASIECEVLRGLTKYVPKLNKLELASCQTCYDLGYESGTERVIFEMKSTRVSQLYWTSDEDVYCMPFKEFYMELAIGDEKYFYKGGKSDFQECSEVTFLNTLDDLSCLSLNFSFESLDCIILNTFDFNMKISACNGGYRLEETYPIIHTRPERPIFEDLDNDDSDSS